VTGTKQTFAYKVVDGHPIQADVFVGAGQLPRPVLIWIHGGALISGSRNYLPEDQRAGFLQAGFTVVAIDYRLAPETKLAEIISDLKDASRWVREEGPGLFGADPERVAIMGQSAGGYLTLMTGFCLEPRPRALVAISGYGDIVGPWYSQPDPFYCGQPAISEEEARRAVGSLPISTGGNERYRFYTYCRQRGSWPIEVSGHDPLAESEFFEACCPVRNVTANYPPTLLLHGNQDTDVPYAESVAMAAALARHGVEHELITVEEGGHNFETANGGLKDPANAARFARIIAFLSRHV